MFDKNMLMLAVFSLIGLFAPYPGAAFWLLSYGGRGRGWTSPQTAIKIFRYYGLAALALVAANGVWLMIK